MDLVGMFGQRAPGGDRRDARRSIPALINTHAAPTRPARDRIPSRILHNAKPRREHENKRGPLTVEIRKFTDKEPEKRL